MTPQILWFTEFGGPNHQRPVQDLAFAVARFIQKSGSFVNYYMYHGGTNFGRSAGGPFITTSYDYDASIDEYGLIGEPKYSHLKELHKAIKQCEPALVSSDPIITSLGTYQQAHVFSSGTGACSAFLANYHTKSSARVTVKINHYDLPPWSISILPDCRNVVFITANVRVQTSQAQMLPTNSKLFSWETYDEDLSSLDETSGVTAAGLLEQINVTRDTSDYGTLLAHRNHFFEEDRNPVSSYSRQAMPCMCSLMGNFQGLLLGQGNKLVANLTVRSIYALELIKLAFSA